MKRRLFVFLSIEALACLLFSLYGLITNNALASISAFPFEQIGLGLRALSVSGVAGNVFSIVIYCVLCLSPIFYFVLRVRKKLACAEDSLLIVLSAVLFVVIYFMINPAYIARHFGAAEIVGIAKAFLGLTVYSVAAGYIILRALRVFKDSVTGSMLKYLRFLLYAVCALLVYGIFGSGLANMFSSFEALAAGNTDVQNLTPSYFFLVLQYAVCVLPLVLEIAIIFAGLKLVNALQQDPYGSAVALAAKETGRICRGSVIAIMLSQIGINVLQFALGSLVRTSHYSLSIPLMSVVFTLVAMLLARYFEQARQIKDENDGFI